MHAKHADSDRLDGLWGRWSLCPQRLNALGIDLLEKVYENALAHEMRAAGLVAAQQCSFRVHYHDAAALPLHFGKPRLKIKRIVDSL